MKRLYKSRRNKVIDGVCGGVAEYFDVDPVLIRIIFVLFFFFGGSGLLAYIVGIRNMQVLQDTRNTLFKSGLQFLPVFHSLAGHSLNAP